MTLIQTAPLTGAVVVTTPSDVSLEDARKAILMFQQVRKPVLGLVENMSYLLCPHCAERIDVFSHGVGRKTAELMRVHFLGETTTGSKGADRRRFGTSGDYGGRAGVRHAGARSGEESGRTERREAAGD